MGLMDRCFHFNWIFAEIDGMNPSLYRKRVWRMKGGKRDVD